MRPGVPVLTTVIIGVTVGLMAAAADAQQLRWPCGGHDGHVSAQDVPSRAAQRFERVRQGADGLGAEQFAAAATGAEGLRQQFIHADHDGDGRISRDEWLRWFGTVYAGAMAGADGPHSGTDLAIAARNVV
jgi:hypothetical protein